MISTTDGTIAVVGASLAGLRGAEELRREGFTGRLVIIGADPDFPPYDKPPLSKEVLTGEWTLERARLKNYEPLDAEMLLGRRAVGLNLEARQVELDDDQRIDFDGLLIATGARVRRLRCTGSELAGIHYFRDATDCAAVQADLEHAKSVVIIGGGFIGAEAASACRSLGVDTTIVDIAPLPLTEILGEEVARYLSDRQERNGTRVIFGVGVDAITGTDRVEAVQLANGTSLVADVVIAGLGVSPETDWLKDSELTIEDGVLCDAYCAALGVEDVTAAGDVARWFHPLFQRVMRVEHWTNAIEQGEYAARTLLGHSALSDPYQAMPYFWSDQCGNRLQFVGIPGREHEVVEGSLDEDQFVMLHKLDGLTVGALCVNWPGRLPVYRRLIEDELRSV